MYEWHLIDEPFRSRYHLHDLVRDHATGLAVEDPVDEGTAALHRRLSYYRSAARAAHLIFSERSSMLRLPNPPDPADASREASNARTRMRSAAFPVIKTPDELDRTACSIPVPTLDYLASLEWITAKENLVLVGPAVIRRSISSVECFRRS